MSLNKVVLNGRIPNFDGFYNKDESGKSYLAWSLSVKRNYKPEGEQYYPEDLIRFKAFNQKADFIKNNFNQGDGIIISGRLQIDPDREDEEGNQVKGQMFVLVEEIIFAEGTVNKNNTSKNTNANNSSNAAPSKPISRPAPVGAGRKPSIPGKGAKSSIPPRRGNNIPF